MSEDTATPEHGATFDHTATCEHTATSEQLEGEPAAEMVTDLAGDRSHPAPSPTDTVVEIVIPVHNEETDLAASIRRLEAFLAEGFPYHYQVTIADNASTDQTWAIAESLAIESRRVRAVHLDAKGRGRALKQVWATSGASILCYMDVDLSTDLRALLPLVAPLVSGHSDLAIGTRLAASSRVIRGPKREFISRSYNLLPRGTLGVSFSDAQCGFKAIRADVAARVLPLCEDNNWFFDTELLVLAQRSELRIHEVPVDWVDDPNSTVNIIATAAEDVRGIVRLARGLATRRIGLDRIRPELSRTASVPSAVPGVPRGLLGQLARFAGVGVISTLAYLAIYWLLRTTMDAQLANALALVITALANTAANRRLTFGVKGRRGLVGDHAGGLAAFGVGLALTSGSLALLHHFSDQPHRTLELVVLTVANAIATGVRFLTLRQLLHHRVGSRGRSEAEVQV